MKADNGRPGFDRRMSREEINLLPINGYQGAISLVHSAEDLDRVVEELAGEPILGFDTETRPAFVKGQQYPPALIQLATASRVYIFQLHQLKFRQRLRRILASPGIVKAGVAVGQDVRQLQALEPFNAAGFVDLADLAQRAGIKNHGLRGMAAVLLGFRIVKGPRKSNWAKETLTEAQIRYAATDAWVSRELYLRLLELGA